MLRNIVLLFCLGCLLVSCSIEESTTFNSDFSGKSITKIDMTAMIAFISSMDTTGDGKSKFYREIQQGMDSVKKSGENALNLEMSFDTVANTLNMGITFKSLDEANALAKKFYEQQKSMGQDPPVLYRWEKKNKVLVMPGPEDLSKLAGGGGSSNPMLSKMTYSLVRTFPMKIAKVSDSRIKLSNGNKTMTFEATAEQIMESPLKEITVTFK